MQPPQVQPDGSNKFTADMMIYDEESDRHVRIPWLEALMASGAIGLALANGQKTLSGPPAADAKLIDWVNAALQIAAYSSGEKIGVSTTGVVTMGAAVSSSTAAAWAPTASTPAAGVFLPPADQLEATLKAAYTLLKPNIRIVVARPFSAPRSRSRSHAPAPRSRIPRAAVEHLMHSVILTVSGRDTGATLFGPADMQLSANTQVKTIEGHYTGHFKAVITKPQSTPPSIHTLSMLALTSIHSQWQTCSSCATWRAAATSRATTRRGLRRTATGTTL